MYTNQDYLIHHGVKGMKWGVRKDPQRFSNGIKKVTYSKGYRKAVRGIARSPFGAAAVRVGSISNKNLRKGSKEREEYEELRKIGKKEDAQSYKYNKPNESGAKGAKRAINAKLDSKLGKVGSKQKYSKGNGFLKQAGKNAVQNYKDGAAFYSKSIKSIKNSKPKEIGKHYSEWLNKDVNVLGVTGSKTMKRKRYVTGLYNPMY